MKITSVRDIIAQWPSRQAFAEDVERPLEQIHKWAQHNAIPAWHQASVLAACRKKGVPVTGDMLVAMHADKEHRARRGAESAA